MAKNTLECGLLLTLIICLFPVCYSQCAENGVCSYQQSYQQSVKASYQTSFNQRFTVSCGVFNWASCTRYRRQYQMSYRTEYRSVYRTAYQCCTNWIQSGSQCSPVCSSLCLNGGSCCAPNTCSCLAGYTGDRCQTPICFPYCENGGNCTRPNKCDCPSGYTGDTCRTPICSPICENGMICISPNTCDCPIGYTGDQCQTHSESCPENVEIFASPGMHGGIAIWNVTQITSEYQNDTNVTSTHESGDFFPIGVTIVQYTFNSNTDLKKCSFSVTVEDAEPPKLECPTASEYFTESQQTVSINVEPEFITDNSGQTPQLKFYTLVNETFVEIRSRAEFPIGQSRVRIEAFDPSQNNASCEFIILVTARCSSHTSQSIRGELSWEATAAGSTIESLQRCPLETEGRNQASATRRCYYNATMGAVWEDAVLNDCGRTTDYQEDILSMINITSYNVEEVTEALLDVTTDSIEADRELDLADVIQTIENIVSVESPASDITANLGSIVDTIMGAGFVTQSEDISSGGLTSDMVLLLEDQVSHTLLGVNQFEYSGDHLVGMATTVTNNEDVRSGFRLHVLMNRSSEDVDNNSLDDNSSFGENTELISSIGSQIERDDMEISILLSEEVFSTEHDTRMSFIVMEDDSLFKSDVLSTFQGHGELRKDIVAPIISATVFGAEFGNLKKPVIFRTYSEKIMSDDANSTCVFWDYERQGGIGDWSEDGCEVVDVVDGWITCACYHLSTFAAIVEFPSERDDTSFPIKIITEVGCGISIIGLVIVIAVIFCNGNIGYSRSVKLFLIICLSLILLYVFVIMALEFSGQAKRGLECQFVAACVHYLVLTTVFGMAFYIRSIYIRLTDSERNKQDGRFLFVASCVIWGVPFLLVVVSFVLNFEDYTFGNKCFVSSGDVLNFGLLFPFGVLVQHNVITLIFMQKGQTTSKRTWKQNLRDGILAFILEIFWISWVILETKTIKDQDGIFFLQLLLSLSGSYFGGFIALFFCFQNIIGRCYSKPHVDGISLTSFE